MTAADNSPEDLPNNSAAKGTEPAGSREPSSPISRRKPRKRKKLLIVLCVVLAILFALTAAAFVALKIGEGKLRKRASGNPKLPSIDTEEMPEDADAYYQGEAYFYNHNLINLLLIGIDRADPETNTSHQADALYLFSLDTAANHANVLAISRNTMADVAVYDINNRYLSTQKQQICMAYSYGKTPTQSAELTVQAVSDFLCGVPISGYYAAGILYMPAKRDTAEKGLAMNGLIRAEENLVTAMDKEKAGEYVPRYALTKSGSLDKRCSSFIGAEDFSEIFHYIERLMADTGRRLSGGDIAVAPRDGRESPACKYCDYRSVCGRENEPNKRVPQLDREQVFSMMKGEDEHGL
ncbi:MAG: PD-(D/E)XK nuclease family protein [Clostridia bacterium]|nr:PD-(D/E)XK nuclease family protein [Clostridia bacterium]